MIGLDVSVFLVDQFRIADEVLISIARWLGVGVHKLASKVSGLRQVIEQNQFEDHFAGPFLLILVVAGQVNAQIFATIIQNTPRFDRPLGSSAPKPVAATLTVQGSEEIFHLM